MNLIEFLFPDKYDRKARIIIRNGITGSGICTLEKNAANNAPLAKESDGLKL
jgi:hypothetical protein